MYTIFQSSGNYYRAILLMLLVAIESRGQILPPDSTLQVATLENVVKYALENQPAIRQARLDQQITLKAVRGRLADWYPQINAAYNYQRFIDLQASVIGGNVIRFGVNNTSSMQFTATQTIFNRDVLLAATTSDLVRIQSEQNTSRSQIDAVVNVTKAFYDVLATAQQIRVNEESIARLDRSLKDAYSRYTAGLSDKTDYKRATILLRNAQASLKTNQELLAVKEQYLKALMGYPGNETLRLRYDTLQMESEIAIDTLRELHFPSNIDYKLLYTQKELQRANLKYSQWAFLPSINLFGAYNLNYQNNAFSELYNTQYPFSYIGATLSLPLFQGGKRLWKVQEQKLATERMDVGLINLENNLNAEHTRALAAYKSNLNLYRTQKENVEMAQEVYDVVQLQYENGVKTYLDVTIAESDLRTTRINYFNSLYQVLASKMDVQRVLGLLNY